MKISHKILIPLLSGGVPNLRLDALPVYGHGSGLELDTYRRLRIKEKFILGKPPEQLALPDRRVADHDDLEDIVRLCLLPLPTLLHLLLHLVLLFFVHVVTTHDVLLCVSEREIGKNCDFCSLCVFYQKTYKERGIRDDFGDSGGDIYRVIGVRLLERKDGVGEMHAGPLTRVSYILFFWFAF
jgi:hypothetical protein